MSQTTELKLRVAAKAVIVNDDGEVLLLREGTTGKDNTNINQWGLVGGRIEPGEAFIDALHREVKEESGLEVEVVRPLYVGEWRPVIRGVPHQIIAIFMLCKAKTTEVRLSDEHDAYEWVAPTEHRNYKMMDPDDKVLDQLAA